MEREQKTVDLRLLQRRIERKYKSIDSYTPDTVGKARIANTLYTMTVDSPKTSLFTNEEMKVLTALITTSEDWRRYWIYDGAREWLLSRHTTAIMQSDLLKTALIAIQNRLFSTSIAENAEINLPKDEGRGLLYLHKIDSAMFCFSEVAESNEIIERDNIQASLNWLAAYNKKVSLIADEIAMPEVCQVFAIDLDNTIAPLIERINSDIAEIKRSVYETYEDDGGIGTIKRNAFIEHLRPYSAKPNTIPRAKVQQAKERLAGLDIFTTPTGASQFDRLL